MIEIKVELTNEDARQARGELQQFLRYQANRMAADYGSAARAWAIGDKFLRAIDAAITAQDAKFEAENGQ